MYQSALPSSSLGYWRGTAEGLSGPSLEVAPVAANGTMGTSSGTGAITIGQVSWHPSVLYLLGLVIAEMIVFGWIGRVLK